MSTYRVVVTGDGDGWLAKVPDLDGCLTWADDRADLDRNIREAIAVVEDLPEGAETGLAIAYEYPQT